MDQRVQLNWMLYGLSHYLIILVYYVLIRHFLLEFGPSDNRILKLFLPFYGIRRFGTVHLRTHQYFLSSFQ